jgi:hypothetical protein
MGGGRSPAAGQTPIFQEPVHVDIGGALGGLRAFFYAGACALLVSHWVDSSEQP